jgi:hypothetical protein
MKYSARFGAIVLSVVGTGLVLVSDALADSTSAAYRVCEAYEKVTGLDERECFELVDANANKNRFPQAQAVALCSKVVVFSWNPTDCLQEIAGKHLTERQLQRCQKHVARGFSLLDSCL